MKLTVVVPVITDALTDEVRADAGSWVSSGTEVEVRRIARGTESIESEYDMALAGPGVLEAVREASDGGADAVFVSCFSDPAVHAAREIVDIPVVGGFEPAVLTSLALGERTGVITVLPDMVPLLHGLVRRYGLAGRIGTIRTVGIPVLHLRAGAVGAGAGPGGTGGADLLDALTEQARAAVTAREADVIVLGCTGMLGVAAALQERLARQGPFVPVVDPTAAALTWLETQVRLGLRPSRTTYLPPRRKNRVS
ncbi:aspartate/glutamate racemase family protein [Streptomyces poonensis]|uniref:Asp/Glu/hydantoin racemase n=1 Tax=Streptomyces poonensis TaxID=68255 RepID=A0A918PFP1_9ACTN|nr:aspartate/glutamate racemase family protein [Streptomyces poonensis]GGZ02972.1 Asp/Glu/hydantoin racemase [Streptomyces poonensis]GLJ92935.1 Asp/Glu/hydantoin racemase [Streptomyces poonensis]